jgi:hypothetical protein
MRAAVLAVGLVVIACGDAPYPALWSVEQGVVVCPGATERYEWDNATNEVREPGTGDLVVCIWSCTTYYGTFGGREVTANRQDLHLEVLRTENSADGSGWTAIQESAGQESCPVPTTPNA